MNFPLHILTKTFDELPIGVGVFKVHDLNDIKSIEYVFMNKVVLHEMRKSGDEVFGKKIIDVAPEAFEHQGGRMVMETYAKIAKEGGSINLGLVEYSNHLVAGTYECSVHHIEENYIYVMLKNVTELEQMKNNLELANKDLRAKNREVEELVYIASHDIQEPLRSRTTMVDMFAEEYEETLDHEGVDYLHKIKDRTKRLHSIVSDLLNYSKIGQNSEVEELDTNILLQEIITDFSDIIQRTNSIIKIENVSPVKGAKTELRLLFQNLISNAIKFSRPGVNPEIKIGAVEGSPLKFYVKDNGIGIDEKEKESIFKMFKRLNSKSEYEGTGIGLAHCLKIINKYHGDIWVESTPGQGSTFYFTLK